MSFDSHKATVTSEKMHLQESKIQASPQTHLGETFAEVDEESEGSVKGLIGKLLLLLVAILVVWVFCCKQ